MSEKEKLLRAVDTVDNIRKAAMNVVFPLPKGDEHSEEYIQLHWCPKCGKYHKAS